MNCRSSGPSGTRPGGVVRTTTRSLPNDANGLSEDGSDYKHVFPMEQFDEAFRIAGDVAQFVKVTFDLS